MSRVEMSGDEGMGLVSGGRSGAFKVRLLEERELV